MLCYTIIIRSDQVKTQTKEHKVDLIAKQLQKGTDSVPITKKKKNKNTEAHVAA